MTETGKLGEAPAHNSPVAKYAKFLADGYGLPAGYEVVRVVRHGGRDGTGLDVFIRPPGNGGDLRISYPHESDCWTPAKLRSRAAANTNGLTRSALLTSQKAALAMYEAMCSMADHFEAADERGQTWEWVQHLRRVAAVTTGQIKSYRSLKRLQDHDYSKRLVLDPPKDKKGEPARPTPLLLEDDSTGYVYVTARHMAVFLRHDLGVEDAGTDDRILTRLTQIGGKRVDAGEWNESGRARTHKVRLVLYRLPEDPPPDDETDAEDT